MLKIGVVSIHPEPASSTETTFDMFYDSFGKNTGNYMFTQAMFRQFDAEITHIGFGYDPDHVNQNLDHVVIPAANWLNANANWDWLSDLIERTTVPVTTIGIGLQAHTTSLENVKVSPSAVRFAHLIAKKSPYFSARGNFTRDWLNSIGIDNVVVTGCPSLYMKLMHSADRNSDGMMVFQSTRYWMEEVFLRSTGVNRELFKFAAKSNSYMIFQSEIEEIEYKFYGDRAEHISSFRGKLLPLLYGVNSLEEVFNYIDARGRVFLNLEEWSNFLRSKKGLLGTRLHGSILSLNSEVPAILFAHDSRTQEMIEFAKIPTIENLGVANGIPSDIFETEHYQAMQSAYYGARKENSKTYVQFLEMCGLPPKEDNLLLT